MSTCKAITWQSTEQGNDYVMCSGPATSCIIVGLYRHERADLCEAHQKYFIDKCRWVVFDADSLKAVDFDRARRVLLDKKCWGWQPWHDAALQQITNDAHKG